MHWQMQLAVKVLGMELVFPLRLEKAKELW